MDTRYLESIKRFEGFTAQAKWDYAQYSNGYGTKAAFPGEVVDREEAARRFEAEIKAAAGLVDQFAPNVDEGTRAALTSLTFNAGPRWMQSGLGAAVNSGDFEKARSIFLKYTKAGGEDLPGLVSRRLEEVTWFGGGSTAGDAFREVELASAGVKQEFSTTAISVARHIPPADGAAPGRVTNRAVVEDASASALIEQVKMDQLRTLTLRLQQEEDTKRRDYGIAV